ncbi:thioredoxin family protein [Helicobacter didelphidarum]|uniref:Thioredoxin family protein n=2 Tax=Helicobacter didelphidarum TaxID=2040648 RepID=A0A3D8IQX9_9HELI|nr:thioredoxin family protein [Helicobacter didelphidarum]
MVAIENFILKSIRSSFLFYYIVFLYIATSFVGLYANQIQSQEESVKQPVANVSLETDLDSVFLDSREIIVSDKPVMLVFGKNDCYHCSVLNASLIGNATIQGYIMLNFSPYFINIDDKKKHTIPYLSLSRISSIDTARLYKIHALPLIVFISTDSEEIMRISGFPGEARMIHLLEFINNDIWKNFHTPKERIEGFLEYESTLVKPNK